MQAKSGALILLLLVPFGQKSKPETLVPKYRSQIHFRRAQQVGRSIEHCHRNRLWGRPCMTMIESADAVDVVGCCSFAFRVDLPPK